jgi:hypothetical protein
MPKKYLFAARDLHMCKYHAKLFCHIGRLFGTGFAGAAILAGAGAGLPFWQSSCLAIVAGSTPPRLGGTIPLKWRTKNAKAFHDKCENG